MLLGERLGSVNVINLDCKESIYLGKALGALDGLLLGKNDGIELRSSKFTSDVNTDGKFEVLFLGA